MAEPRRVLVTRPEGQAAELCDALERAGIRAIPLPLISIEPDEYAGDHIAWQLLDSYDWILFTSSNGVAHAWPHAPDALRRHPNIAVVGPATANAVTTRGGTVRVVAPIHIAESLADSIGHVAGLRVLWLRGSEARDVLGSVLRARGALMDEIVVYHTQPAALPADAAQRVQSADVLSLASPSAARRFVECFGTAAARQVVCIGPVTAAVARASGLHVDAIAESYTASGLLTALAGLHG